MKVNLTSYIHMEGLLFYTKPTKFGLKVCHLRRTRRSVYALLSILFLFLIAYNSVTLLCTHLTFLATTTHEGSLDLEHYLGKSRNIFYLFSSAKHVVSVMHAMEEKKLAAKPHAHLAISRKTQDVFVKLKGTNSGKNRFSAKIRGFLHQNLSNSSPCKQRFFMTWISSLEEFSEREIFAIESLFKSHPNGCLIMVSDTMDSTGGMLFFRPFIDKGFKVMTASPDYNYLFKNTPAQDFVGRLLNGKIKHGEVSLGQNLSNLLRLGLLYKFGGIYLDTDVIVLKSFAKLRNVIGAQSVDPDTKTWSRLNNGVMIFDKGHPLVYKFIQEFSLTFDGNKWGHNGPYLVSRVATRVKERPGYNFTVLSPMAFYPVDWSRIGSLFEGAGGNETRAKWLVDKLVQIQARSFAVHLWNKQSRTYEVEEGSIISRIVSGYCLFCNSSTL